MEMGKTEQFTLKKNKPVLNLFVEYGNKAFVPLSQWTHRRLKGKLYPSHINHSNKTNVR